MLILCILEGGGGGEREREIERERQTETDRQTDRGRERGREREGNKVTYIIRHPFFLFFFIEKSKSNKYSKCTWKAINF